MANTKGRLTELIMQEQWGYTVGNPNESLQTKCVIFYDYNTFYGED